MTRRDVEASLLDRHRRQAARAIAELAPPGWEPPYTGVGGGGTAANSRMVKVTSKGQITDLTIGGTLNGETFEISLDDHGVIVSHTDTTGSIATMRHALWSYWNTWFLTHPDEDGITATKEGGPTSGLLRLSGDDENTKFTVTLNVPGGDATFTKSPNMGNFHCTQMQWDADSEEWTATVIAFDAHPHPQLEEADYDKWVEGVSEKLYEATAYNGHWWLEHVGGGGEVRVARVVAESQGDDDCLVVLQRWSGEAWIDDGDELAAKAHPRMVDGLRYYAEKRYLATYLEGEWWLEVGDGLSVSHTVYTDLIFDADDCLIGYDEKVKTYKLGLLTAMDDA